MNRSINFSRAALTNLDEIDVDVDADVARLIAGQTTAAALLAECLDGADDDRIQGWRDYVEAVEDYAAPRRESLAAALRGLRVTKHARTVVVDDDAVRWSTTREAWDDAIAEWDFAPRTSDADEIGVLAYDRLCLACRPCVVLGGNAGDSGDPESLDELRDALIADGVDLPKVRAWTYEGYWNVVLGGNRSAETVVAEFELDPSDRRGVDEWLSEAEEASRSAGGLREAPAEWAQHHARALDELCSAEVAS